MSEIFLSIVVPAFNEESRIAASVETLVRYLASQPYTWEVLVVDDGSTDRTAAITRDASRGDDRVRSESVEHGGKGWAVKHGMLAATGRYRFMCDADLAMPVEQLSRFLEQMEKGYDVVIGSRQMAGARRFNEPPGRHVIGRVFNWIVRLLAIGGYQDTQCGFKCFESAAADALFTRQRLPGFGFDVEILYLARKMGLSTLEIPIDWHHQENSKVRPVLDSLSMLWDTALIRWRGLSGR